MKPIDLGRRDALRSAFEKFAEQVMQQTEERVVQKRYLRPPGALPEMAFLAACTRCGECVKACPVDAIVKAPAAAALAAGTPYIDPLAQGCIACPDMPCAAACPTEALTVPADHWEGYRIGVLEFVPERCVTFKHVVCTACADACPQGEAALVIDSHNHPVLRIEGCVGCGSCLKACITSPPSFTLRPAGG